MPRKQPGIHRTRPTLIGVPYDANSSFLLGTAEAPPLIRQALFSPAAYLWTEELIDLDGVLDDAGDLDLAPGMDVNNEIEVAITNLLNSERVPIVLGGDHSITYPIVRALRRVHQKLSLLQFDAHPDLYLEFEGNRYSHACPFARIMEEKLVDQLVQVGIRAMDDHELNQARNFGVKMITMSEWKLDYDVRLENPVYISFDVDSLDPAFAPGVSHREPGGLSVRDVLEVIQTITVPIVGADIVEFNPRQDPVGLTAPVCAKLAKELAGKILGCTGRE
jgi:agmatinase